ncbi:unnamed protein product [Pseudo-nitzschia multistriata]|uniref:Isochorismatase-like domain-containing protein n=1 Tax=Pseudo-nitzschia multistriata TaxID=183589 RepID=A0A448Z9A0_9STRA|nr:unnamed protein product [Pseudo-nitzschia multistriata]
MTTTTNKKQSHDRSEPTAVIVTEGEQREPDSISSRQRSSWVPSIVEIPAQPENSIPSLTTLSSERQRQHLQRPGLRSKSNGRRRNRKQRSKMNKKQERITNVVLVVVGVRFESENYWMEDCPAILREDFPHFRRNLKNTIGLCRQMQRQQLQDMNGVSHPANVTKIIHLHSVQKRSQEWKTFRAPSSRSPTKPEIYPTNDQKQDNSVSMQHPNIERKIERCGYSPSLVDSYNNYEANERCKLNGEDAVCPQQGELLIPSPSWSSSGEILLLDALRKIAATGNQKKLQLPAMKHCRSHSHGCHGCDYDNGDKTFLNQGKTQIKNNNGKNNTIVLVCGLVTSVCVLNTAMVCREEGYRTFIIEDACADRGRERHDRVIEELHTQLQQQHYSSLPHRVSNKHKNGNKTSNVVELLTSYRDLVRFFSPPQARQQKQHQGRVRSSSAPVVPASRLSYQRNNPHHYHRPRERDEDCLVSFLER